MELPLNSTPKFDLVVVGGGAAGFMGAITAAEETKLSVLLLEATKQTLEKVRISGGGRCNVTNACWDPSELSEKYPRGRLALVGLFSRFASGDAVEWFEAKGLHLVEESDGRMFPLSNSSSEVINCLRDHARRLAIQCQINSRVISIDYLQANNFVINYAGGRKVSAENVLLATGGSPSGRKLARSLGHQIVDPVPSLFTFNLDSSSLKTCAGIALKDVSLKLIIHDKTFKEKGVMLITHWGVSGPAVLRLSAFAARALSANKYQCQLEINWTGLNRLELLSLLAKHKHTNRKKSLFSSKPFHDMPKRFWLMILNDLRLNLSKNWGDFSGKDEEMLVRYLVCSSYSVRGRGPFGEEFVTAGGIDLDEVDCKTMQSRKCKGLYFAGELLNIDGITGGFNFQHCWTSGWHAGKAIATNF